MNDGDSPMLSRIMLALVLGDDLADDVLDLAEDPLGLLDPGAGRGPDVQPELAGIDRREEVLADPGGQRQRAQGEAQQRRPASRSGGPGTSPAAAGTTPGTARTGG